MVLFILVDTWHRLSVKSMPLEERARSTSQRPDRKVFLTRPIKLQGV